MPQRGAAQGRPQINVQLNRTGSGRNFGMISGMNRTNVRPDGFFDIAGVVPGSYTLTANARQNGQQFSSRMRLEVGDSGLENLTVTLRPGVPVTGKIFLDGVPPQEFKMTQLRVTLAPTEDFQGGGVAPGGTNGTVAEDGSFTLPSVPPLEYRVRVAGLPQGAYLMAGRVGSDEALNEPFAITGDQQVVLQLQIGFGAGRIQGTVQDARGAAYQGALVTLVPDEPRRLRTELYFSTPTDQYGRYAFSSVPPGSYRVFAWEEIPSGAHMDPEFIRRFEDRGRVIKVERGNSLDAQIPVISRQ
jgi:hypothetical protein